MCPQVQRRSDRQAYEISYPAPLSSHSCPLLFSPFPLFLAFHVFLPFFIPFSCFSFLLVPYRALSTVISTERRRLSFQPSFHSTLQKPASPTAHPIPPSFAYPTYEAKNSILWYRLGRLLAQDVWREAGIFIPVGAPKAMSRER